MSIPTTFQSRWTKVALANIHKVFKKTVLSFVYDILNFKKQRTYAHSVFVYAFPARSPRICHLPKCTDREGLAKRRIGTRQR